MAATAAVREALGVRLRFGDCVFDSDTRELLRGGIAVPVAPKVFQLLEALIVERPRALSKAILHERLWPGTFVTDSNLVNLVADLRLAVGDDGKKPHIIRTVQRFGYAFQAEAIPEEVGTVGGRLEHHSGSARMSNLAVAPSAPEPLHPQPTALPARSESSPAAPPPGRRPWLRRARRLRSR